jgi:hypothetical protein
MGIIRNLLGLLTLGATRPDSQKTFVGDIIPATITGGLTEAGYHYRSRGSYRRQKLAARKRTNKKLHPKGF